MISDDPRKSLKSQGETAPAQLIASQLTTALARVLDEALPLAAARLAARIAARQTGGGAIAPADHLPPAPTPYAILARPEVRA